MKWWFLLIGWLLGFGGSAQVYYVTPGGSGDGTSWEKAGGNLENALTSVGVKEVRVKWGVYPLEKELIIPAGVVMSGGWGVDGERQAGGTEATVLQAVGKSRVATVSGTLDGFTVCGGIAAGKDGGGLYVKATGTVLNCIVKDNYSGDYYPRVGDVQLSDGTFLRRDEIGPSDEPRIRGIVFWVNPDPDAPVGKRGWLAAKDGVKMQNESWSTEDIIDVNVTGYFCNSVKEALEDTAGWQHCREVQKANLQGKCTMIAGCLSYFPPGLPGEAGKWYLPAVGQLRYLLNEYKEMNLTYWKIYPGEPSYEFMFNEAMSSSERKDNISGYISGVWNCNFNFNIATWGKISASNKKTTGNSFYYIPVTSF